jgi:hypothetical protein
VCLHNSVVLLLLSVRKHYLSSLDISVYSADISGPNVPSWNEYFHVSRVVVFIFSLRKFLLGSNGCLIPHIKSYPDMTYVLGLKYCMFLWIVDFVQISVMILGFQCFYHDLLCSLL